MVLCTSTVVGVGAGWRGEGVGDGREDEGVMVTASWVPCIPVVVATDVVLCTSVGKKEEGRGGKTVGEIGGNGTESGTAARASSDGDTRASCATRRACSRNTATRAVVVLAQSSQTIHRLLGETYPTLRLPAGESFPIVRPDQAPCCCRPGSPRVLPRRHGGL